LVSPTYLLWTKKISSEGARARIEIFKEMLKPPKWVPKLIIAGIILSVLFYYLFFSVPIENIISVTIDLLYFGFYFLDFMLSVMLLPFLIGQQVVVTLSAKKSLTSIK